MESNNLSIVIQGPLYKEYPIKETLIKLRKIFPNSQIILSTSDHFIDEDNILDHYIKNEDIGGLSPLKFDHRPNNINRQIKSTISGIKLADRPVLLKLRTDLQLNSDKILSVWDILQDYNNNRKFNISNSRIITISLYSLNPRAYERLPYHVSDITLLGYREDLERYFSCPYYTEEYASWYEYHSHINYSNKLERKFRSKYAVEQWLCLNFMYPNQDFPIAFHNDHNQNIIDEFEERLVDTFFICHPQDIDLSTPKFQKSYESFFCNLFCYSTKDSQAMLKEKRNIDMNFEAKYAFPDSIEQRNFFFKLYLLSPYLVKRLFNLRKTFIKAFGLFSIFSSKNKDN